LDVNADGVPDIPGYEYKRFETWSDDGLGDIEAGLKYQYFKNDKWRLAVTGAVRFPTGEVDDPDDLWISMDPGHIPFFLNYIMILLALKI
jgi:hypothetical protein